MLRAVLRVFHVPHQEPEYQSRLLQSHLPVFRVDASRGIENLLEVRPIHIPSYIEHLLLKVSRPTVKLQLAALRILFNWLVVRQVIENPAHAVRGPKHSVKKGQDTGPHGGGNTCYRL